VTVSVQVRKIGRFPKSVSLKMGLFAVFSNQNDNAFSNSLKIISMP